MADSDQILQLGIEEARNGNREAARNLFELLTRQEPDNAQAWLWLAGVADGPDQRREALQRVMALEPENEMARKGLQAMGAETANLHLATAGVRGDILRDLGQRKAGWLGDATQAMAAATEQDWKEFRSAGEGS